jgi:hypothetical protein
MSGGDDITKRTNSEKSSDDYQEEQPTLPAETSQDDPTRPTPGDNEKKVVVRPSSEEQQHKSSSVPAKAKEVGQSLKEKVKSVGKKTVTKTEEKTKQLKDKSTQTAGIGPRKDAHDIQALGSTRLEKVATLFEDTMTEINKEPDREGQKKQLTGYKKLLEEQINVIDSCLKMVKRLRKDG